jgi:hypothetical protein
LHHQRTRVAGAALAAIALVTSAACTRPAGGHRDHGHGSGGGRRTLFGPPPDGTSPTTTPDGDRISLDSRVIEGDPDEIGIRLPTGETTARRQRVVRRGAEGTTWYGRTDGARDDNVIVTREGDQVAVHVETDDGTVTGHTTGPGVGVRTSVDRGELREETEPEVEFDAEDAEARAAAEAPPPGEVTASAVGDTIVDVMVVYNTSTATRYGSSVRALVQNAVDRGNKAFTDSQINVQFRLVAVERVADREIAASWLGGNIRNLQRSTVVAGLRDRYGADLVQAWGTYPNVCGQGYQQTGSGLPAAYGLSVVNNIGTCVQGVAPVHEWGHNLGGGHDRTTDGSRRPGDAYGLLDTRNDFITIMAYQNRACPGGSCTQSWLFSNPNVQFRGFPTGRAGTEDNARNIRLYAPIVANYRPSRV